MVHSRQTLSKGSKASAKRAVTNSLFLGDINDAKFIPLWALQNQQEKRIPSCIIHIIFHAQPNLSTLFPMSVHSGILYDDSWGRGEEKREKKKYIWWKKKKKIRKREYKVKEKNKKKEERRTIVDFFFLFSGGYSSCFRGPPQTVPFPPSCGVFPNVVVLNFFLSLFFLALSSFPSPLLFPFFLFFRCCFCFIS